MPVNKSGLHGEFTKIPNSVLQADKKTLSANAILLYVRAMSYPPNFIFHQGGLLEMMGFSRKSKGTLTGLMNELRHLGYVTGTFTGQKMNNITFHANPKK